MVLGALKIRKVSRSGPEVLQNFFQECNQHWPTTPPTPSYQFRNLGNMVLGAFKVHESTGTSPRALQNWPTTPPTPLYQFRNVQHLSNMVLGAFKVHESTGTSLEAL